MSIIMTNSKLNLLSKPIFRKISVKNVFQRCFRLQTIQPISVVAFPDISCRRHYSILIYKHKSQNKCLKQSFVNAISCLSTNIDHEKYHVVVTNPSAPVSESPDSLNASLASGSSSASSPADVISADHMSSFPDIAVSLGTELQDVAQTLEPTLASLGLCHWTPVGLVQMLLEYLHVTFDMPWWIAIATCTVAARILLLPVIIKTQKNALHMSNNMPQLQYLQMKFGEARKSGNSIEAGRYANEIVAFMKEHNISPLKNAVFPLLQAPVFISFFLALRAMAKTPVESMQYGGIYWVTDLTVPDPYYILPVISCSTLYIILKVGAESGMKLENLKMAKYALQALPLIALPFCIHFPAAVLYYWVTTNFCTLLTVSILRIKPVRRYLNMPEQKPIDPKFVLPKKGFVSGIKEAYEDQKVLAAAEERRRMDLVRFQQAGTGPIPRTYSYDPTKPRPTNAAAAAARAVSAKKKT